jgi:hypothetical protein
MPNKNKKNDGDEFFSAECIFPPGAAVVGILLPFTIAEAKQKDQVCTNTP